MPPFDYRVRAIPGTSIRLAPPCCDAVRDGRRAPRAPLARHHHAYHNTTKMPAKLLDILRLLATTCCCCPRLRKKDGVQARAVLRTNADIEQFDSCQSEQGAADTGAASLRGQHVHVRGLLGPASAANGTYRLSPSLTAHGRPGYEQTDTTGVGASRVHHLIYNEPVDRPPAWQIKLPHDRVYAFCESVSMAPDLAEEKWTVFLNSNGRYGPSRRTFQVSAIGKELGAEPDPPATTGAGHRAGPAKQSAARTPPRSREGDGKNDHRPGP
eukprot:COSAG02_NODE_18297_length_947_cov_1.398585_1_plen_268_part_01